jgi:DNA-binding NarL/FixJ family response regulator
MVRVYLADDHTLVREGIKQLLDDAGDIIVCGEASTGHQVLQAMQDIDCDVLVLDIKMPGGGGLEVLQKLNHVKSGIRTIILSMYPEEQYAIRALKAGASGYLTKDSIPKELLFAIRKVASGSKYITGTLAERMASELSEKIPPEPHSKLSNREFQVMSLIASGKELSEIADELSLSIKTVSTYRTRILGKLGLRNSLEIIRYAFQNKLVD